VLHHSLMRWEWEGGAVLLGRTMAEDDAERGDLGTCNTDNRRAASASYAATPAAESAANAARSLARAACSVA
jgi:hypothetical protein